MPDRPTQPSDLNEEMLRQELQDRAVLPIVGGDKNDLETPFGTIHAKRHGTPISAAEFERQQGLISKTENEDIAKKYPLTPDLSAAESPEGLEKLLRSAHQRSESTELPLLPDFSEATNFDELIEMVKKAGPITFSDGDVQPTSEALAAISEARARHYAERNLTRRGNLRDTVNRLISEEEKATPPKRPKTVEQPPPPLPPQEKPKRRMGFKVGIVEGARDIEAEARDVAEERMTAGQNELRGISGMAKRIWKYNWGKEYYRQKEIAKARQEILAGNNIYAAETPDQTAQKEAMGAIIDRFTSEHDQEVLQGGEEKKKLGETVEDDRKIQDAIKKLVKDYATGNITEANFEERRNRLIRWMADGTEEPDPLHKELTDVRKKKKRTDEQKNKDFSYADNILQIAQEVKKAVDAGERLEDLDVHLEITIGKARAGVKTEAQFNAVDRIVEKLGKMPVTRLINETTLAGAVAVAYSAGTFFSQRAARSKLLAFGTFGATALLGGGLAAARERVRIEKERQSHFRSMAKGKTFDPDKSPRRKEMNEFVYEMVGAKKLADDLKKSLEEKNYSAILTQIAEIEAREKISSNHKIDLISFSDPTKVEQERTRLMLLKAKAKADLRKLAPDQISASPEKPSGFTYDVPDLVDHKQIEGLLKGNLSAETDPAKRRALLAEWLEQRRLNRIGGYKIPEELNGQTPPFTPKSAAEYKKWDQDQAKKILGAWEKSSGNTPRLETTPEATQNLNDQLANLVGVRSNQLFEGDAGIEQKNRLFTKMKNSKAFKAGVRGVITGLVVGGVAQEVGALLRDNQEGLIEGLMKQRAELESGTTTHFTPLEFIRRYIGGELSPAHHGPLHEVAIEGSNTRFKLPENMSMGINPGGHSYSLYRGEELIDQNIMLQPDGTISLETEGILADHGVVTHTNSFNTLRTETENVWPNQTIDTTKTPDYSLLRPEEAPAVQTTSETVQVKPEDYIKNHPDIKTIHREFWYDNDTTTIDKNELKLGWGGVHGTGIDKEGKFVYSIKGMGANDSFHDKFKINPLEAAKEGKLKLLLSLSRDTQANPIEIPIGPDGNAIIDPKSEIAKMFFKTDAEGQLHFIGKYAEVAEMTGMKDGVEQVRIMATDVGKGLETVTDTVVKNITPDGGAKIIEDAKEFMGPPAPETITKNIIETHREIIFDSPGDYEIDPFPIIPILGRHPLEPLNKKSGEKAPIIPPYNLYPEINPAKREEYLKDMSPRLKENPNAVLDPAVEIPWYFENQKQRYPGYIEELQGLREQIKEPLGKNVEAVVCLAVAGHQEGKNIYRCLETYAVQKNKAGDSIWQGNNSKQEILLYINWPKGKDPSETIQEIDRFKSTYPDVPVRVVSEEITNGKMEVGWYKKKVFDLALLRKQELGDGKDISIIANDADTVYSSPDYLDTVTTEMSRSENEPVDAILGRFDLGPEVYDKNPTFHAIMRFWQYMDALTKRTYNKLYTQGRNTVMKGSSYAAIGGNRTKEFWADIEFGQLINLARNGTKKGIGYLNRAWVMVDPRREIDKFKNGEKIAYTWGDFDSRENVRGGGQAIHKEPENIDLSKLAEAKENSPEVAAWRERLEEELQALVDNFGPRVGTQNYYDDPLNPTYIIRPDSSSKEALKIVKRAAQLEGIKLEVTEESDGHLKIKITDTSKLREKLFAYHLNADYLTKIAKNPLPEII